MKRQFRPRTRKLALLVHVVFAVAWIGFEVMVIVLALAGITTESPRILHAAYVVLGEFGPALYAPFSFGTLISGVVLSLGTHWGLARHYWVIVKLAINLATVLGGNFLIAGMLRQSAERVLTKPIDELNAAAVGSIQYSLLSNALVVITLLLFATVLSYYKPWGKTRFAPAVKPGRARVAPTADPVDVVAQQGNPRPRHQRQLTTPVGGRPLGMP